jgi:hypothetical protein
MRFVLLFILLTQQAVQAEQIIARRVDSINPTSGSTAGGTRVVIYGTGFSVNYIEGGNKIWIGDAECITIEQSGFGACTVLCSNLQQIVCDTSPHVAANNLRVAVTVDMLYPVPNPGNIGFSYVDGKAGMLHSVYPQSGLPGTVVNFYGLGWSTMTDSANTVIGNKLSSFNNVLVGSETARVSSEDGAAVCDRDELNYWKPRYFARADDFVPEEAYLKTYKDNHYRCRLPIYAAGSYKTRINTVYGDVQKDPTSSATDISGTDFEFQYYADVMSVSPKVSGINGRTNVLIQGAGFSTIPEENVVSMDGVACTVKTSTYYTIECETNAYKRAEQTSTYLGGRGLSMHTMMDIVPSGDLSTFRWKSSRRGGFTDCDLKCYFDNKRIELETNHCADGECSDYEVRQHWLENSNDWRDCRCQSAPDGNASRVEASSRQTTYGPKGDIMALYDMSIFPNARAAPTSSGASAFNGQYLQVVRKSDGSLVFELDTQIDNMLRAGVQYTLSFTYRTDGTWSGGDDTNVHWFDPSLIPNTTSVMRSSVEPVAFSVDIIVNPNVDTIECYEPSDQGRSYRGHHTHSEYGETCQPWYLDEPNNINWNDAKDPSPAKSQNYCRNYEGNGQQRPWCYKKGRNGWQYCDIKPCERNNVVFKSLDASFIQISEVQLTDDDQQVTITSSAKHFSAYDLDLAQQAQLDIHGNASTPEPADSHVDGDPSPSTASHSDPYGGYDPTMLNVAADGLQVRQMDEYTENSGQPKLSQAKNYGAFLKGMFVAPATGTYRFSITGDIQAKLKTGDQAHNYQSSAPELSSNQAVAFQEDRHENNLKGNV